MDSIWTEFMGHEIRQSFYDAKGIRTRCIEAGHGMPLIFLHGAGGHAEAYARNILAHAQHFHVYAVDMVGHGYTDKPDLPYDFDTFVTHLGNFVDAIGAEKICLSGESLGSMVSSLYAARNPNRVERLVLNTGLLIPPDDRGRQELQDAIERGRRASGELTREAVRKRIEWLMYEPEKSVTDELVEMRYRIYSMPGAAAVTKKIADVVVGAAVKGAEPFATVGIEQLKRIQCPTLVLWSRHNPGQSVELAERGVKFIAKGRLAVLQNSAHWPQWEEPDEFNRIHLGFLTEK